MAKYKHLSPQTKKTPSLPISITSYHPLPISRQKKTRSSPPQRPRRLFTAIRAASSASAVNCWSSSQTRCAAAGNSSQGIFFFPGETLGHNGGTRQKSGDFSPANMGISPLELDPMKHAGFVFFCALRTGDQVPAPTLGYLQYQCSWPLAGFMGESCRVQFTKWPTSKMRILGSGTPEKWAESAGAHSATGPPQPIGLKSLGLKWP